MSSVLIIVDPQNDFYTGSLPVPNCEDALENMVKLSRMKFDLNVLTLDWHPSNHDSFDVHGGPWPVHCVEGTRGALPVYDELEWNSNIIIHKGTNPNIDSYSGLRENDGQTLTGLSYILEGMKPDEIYVCGLALDYCVKATAIDILDITKIVPTIVTDATQAIGNSNDVISELSEYGIKMIKTDEIKLET